MGTSPAMSTNNDRIKYKITITQNSQNITGNTSNVTVSVRFYRTNTGYTTYGTGTVYCKINGTMYNAAVTSDQKITNAGIVLFTKTLNISHNADGTKTLTTSAWINHSQFNSNEQSYSQVLTTIPRATTPTVSASSVAFGSSITISTPRLSNSFTHTLRYSFAGSSGTIATGVTTSQAWTVPTSLMTKIPNSTSGVITVNCDTYNGSTKIGTKSVTFTATVPSSVVPTISAITVTEGASGIASKIGAFVQGRSKLNVAITAAGASGSTVANYVSTFGAGSYNGASFTISNVNASGTVALKVTVTDSRGRKATLTQNVTVLAYNLPEISAFSVFRCDSNGNADDDGQYINIAYAYDITPLNNRNDKSVTIAYKLVSDTAYTTLLTESNYTNNTTVVPATVFSVDNSYDLRITVADYFKTVTDNAEVTTAFTLLDFSAGGKGVGIGKVAETENLLDVALPIKARGGVSYIPIDTGTDLNSVTAEGLYGGANANSNHANCPISSGTFTLEVKSAGDSGQLYQCLTYCSKTDPATYERFYYGGAWGPWNKVADFNGTLLWSGAYYMNANQTVNLAEAVSDQPTGIVLVFSRYSSGQAQNYHWNTYFVPKYMVANHEGQGFFFTMFGDLFSYVASKYLYINDTSIAGNANNTATGTANGITYANNSTVLRYVIGV